MKLDQFLGYLRKRWGLTRYTPDSLGDTYVKLYRAVVRKRQVRALVNDQTILFCPHALGFLQNMPYVLARRVSDAQARSMSKPAAGAWRWIALADLHDVSTHAGPWYSASEPIPPLDGFEVQIRAA